MGSYDLLFRASFKGVRFLPEGSITTSGGRKLIDHIYPNSDRRFIEDLGKLQEDFTITGIITGPNYLAKRRQLKNALEESGSGRLVHPFFGSIVVVARPYTLVEDLKEIGIGKFSMTFGVATKNIFPTNKGFSNIGNFVSDLRNSINDLLNVEFDTGYADSLLAAESLFNDVFDKFDDISRNFAQVTDNITTFNKIIADAKDNLPNIIRSAALVGEFFNDIFDAVNNLFDLPEDAFNFLKDLFDFQGGDNTKPSTTVIRKQINDNNDIINLSINTLALSNAYLNANLIDYSNDEELQVIVSTLNDQFDTIIDDLNDPVASDLYQLRDSFDQFKDNLLITLDKVITINTEETPVSVLAYRYYGSTDNENSVIALNNTLNPSSVNGDYKIITS